jgi:hypothetical protein
MPDCRHSVKFGQGVPAIVHSVVRKPIQGTIRAFRDMDLLLCSLFVQASVRRGANLVVTPYCSTRVIICAGVAAGLGAQVAKSEWPSDRNVTASPSIRGGGAWSGQMRPFSLIGWRPGAVASRMPGGWVEVVLPPQLLQRKRWPDLGDCQGFGS